MRIITLLFSLLFTMACFFGAAGEAMGYGWDSYQEHRIASLTATAQAAAQQRYQPQPSASTNRGSGVYGGTKSSEMPPLPTPTPQVPPTQVVQPTQPPAPVPTPTPKTPRFSPLGGRRGVSPSLLHGADSDINPNP